MILVEWVSLLYSKLIINCIVYASRLKSSTVSILSELLENYRNRPCAYNYCIDNFYFFETPESYLYKYYNNLIKYRIA